MRPDAADLARLTALAEADVLTVNVDETLPLQEAARAHELSEAGRTRGKVVVTVDWDE